MPRNDVTLIHKPRDMNTSVRIGLELCAIAAPSMSDEEMDAVKEVTEAINNDPRFNRLSSAAKLLALFNVIYWGVETIEIEVAKRRQGGSSAATRPN
jgi:hypothetical protein